MEELFFELRYRLHGATRDDESATFLDYLREIDGRVEEQISNGVLSHSRRI